MTPSNISYVVEQEHRGWLICRNPRDDLIEIVEIHSKDRAPVPIPLRSRFAQILYARKRLINIWIVDLPTND
jgi:hypothetical protein